MSTEGLIFMSSILSLIKKRVEVNRVSLFSPRILTNESDSKSTVLTRIFTDEHTDLAIVTNLELTSLRSCYQNFSCTHVQHGLVLRSS